MKATLSKERSFEILSTSPQDIARLVVQAAECTEGAPASPDRRSASRRPYPTVITVTPLIDDTYEPSSDPLHGIGRHLGNLGLDFFHAELLPEKRAVIGLPTENDTWTHFVIELSWSRFVQSSWYISGGRFTEVIDWS